MSSLLRRITQRMLDSEDEVKLLRRKLAEGSVNPELESILTKLRAITSFTTADMAGDDSHFYGISGVATITFGDLRQWIESERRAAHDSPTVGPLEFRNGELVRWVIGEDGLKYYHPVDAQTELMVKP